MIDTELCDRVYGDLRGILNWDMDEFPLTGIVLRGHLQEYLWKQDIRLDFVDFNDLAEQLLSRFSAFKEGGSFTVSELLAKLKNLHPDMPVYMEVAMGEDASETEFNWESNILTEQELAAYRGGSLAIPEGCYIDEVNSRLVSTVKGVKAFHAFKAKGKDGKYALLIHASY